MISEKYLIYLSNYKAYVFLAKRNIRKESQMLYLPQDSFLFLLLF